MTEDPLGNPVDPRHPWNKVTIPKPQKRDFADKYSWVVSPRIYDKRTDTHVCCDTGGGPFARQWCTAKAGLVDFGYAKATGESIQMVLPRTANSAEMELEWKVPEKSNAIERDRARTYHQAYSALIGAALPRAGVHRGQGRAHEELERLQGPAGGRQRRLPRGGPRRALASHGDPRTARSRTTSPTRRRRGTRACATSTELPAPTRTRCRTPRSSRRTARRTSRASTSCARSAASTRACRAACTCTAAAGRVRKVQHTPTGMC